MPLTFLVAARLMEESRRPLNRSKEKAAGERRPFRFFASI
jgi:hypothetical protein